MKNAYLEATLAETDKQTSGHEACSLKLSPKEIDKEATQGLTESKRNSQTEDTEIAGHTENRRTRENTFEDGMSISTSLERNLDSAPHENEQCIHNSVGQLSLDQTERRPELAEKSDAVHNQFGKQIKLTNL